MSEQQRCNRCVMDTTVPDITFDKDGVCNYCTAYFELWNTRIDRRPLESVISEIKTRGRSSEYDVIQGISGGIDSSYSAYLAHQHGLRVLLVHVDDGWDTPEARYNCWRIAEKTGYDFENVSPNIDEYHDIIRAYLKAGVVGLEAPTDNTLRAEIHHHAKEHDIANILSGGNWATEGILPGKHWAFDNIDAKNIRAIHKRFGTIPLKDFRLMGHLSRVWALTLGGKREYRLLNHMEEPYSREKAIVELANQWGLKRYGPKHHENRLTRFFEAYIFPEKFGFDKRMAHLSTEVCSGQKTREEALELLKWPALSDEVLGKEEIFFFTQLGLEDWEVGAYMESSVRRSHYDFPTEKGRLQIMRFVRRVLRKLMRR